MLLLSLVFLCMSGYFELKSATTAAAAADAAAAAAAFPAV
jgi:hypothetical protein